MATATTTSNLWSIQNVTKFPRNTVFPVKVSLQLRAVIPHPPKQDSQWLWLNLFSARVVFVLFTTSAVPGLSWNKQLTSSACCVDCKSKA